MNIPFYIMAKGADMIKNIPKKRLTLREIWSECEYLNSLNKEEKNQYKSLTIDKKREILKYFKTTKNHNDVSKDNKLNSFFKKRGIEHPSITLINATDKNRVDVFVNKLGNMTGMLSMNLEKQMNYNYHMSQLNQNFINTALLNKIINQNDEIIELLKIIENKE